MSAVLNPSTPAELADAVRSAPRVLAVGAGTNARLAAVGADVVRISTAGLKGIIEYEPSEFTFTALAGTPVRDIEKVLAEQGQYLPFDPLWVEAGATIGGTVAAGVSGPGRFRFGGLRDFVLGVRFVDGEGRLLRMGGKVVKNAAGFDLPKFFVGSLGRFGALAEVTFKVFPRAVAVKTLGWAAPDAGALTTILTEAAGARWELDALEASPAEGAIYARLAGPAEALDGLAAEMLARWPGRVLGAEQASALWRGVREFAWAHDGGELVKATHVGEGAGADRAEDQRSMNRPALKDDMGISSSGLKGGGGAQPRPSDWGRRAASSQEGGGGWGRACLVPSRPGPPAGAAPAATWSERSGDGPTGSPVSGVSGLLWKAPSPQLLDLVVGKRTRTRAAPGAGSTF